VGPLPPAPHVAESDIEGFSKLTLGSLALEARTAVLRDLKAQYRPIVAAAALARGIAAKDRGATEETEEALVLYAILSSDTNALRTFLKLDEVTVRSALSDTFLAQP
jgi:hypothetical protein